MKRLPIILAAVTLASGLFAAWPWLAAPAPYSCRIQVDQGIGGFVCHPVRYACTNITICGLIATLHQPVVNLTMGEPTSYMFSDGEAITRGPDLAGGAWGWSTGRVFSGAVIVTTNTYTRCGHIPVGYAIVGACSNPATITVGGSSITVTGAFDRSIGPVTNGTQISMSTTGFAAIGITTMGSNEWYGVSGIGDDLQSPDETSINTNAGFLVYQWVCTPQTNVVYGCFFKYGEMRCSTNVYHVSHAGYIAAGAQMRVLAVAFFSLYSQQYRFFGWRAYYGTPSAAQVRQWEIDARAEYTQRGYGQ